MTRRPSRITQSELSRALRAAEKAGEGWRVFVRPDGTIEIAKAGDKYPPVIEDREPLIF